MEKHAVKHLAVKPYACTICERGFTRKYYLAAHMEKHHPNGKEETETNTSAVADEIDGEDIFDDWVQTIETCFCSHNPEGCV